MRFLRRPGPADADVRGPDVAEVFLGQLPRLSDRQVALIGDAWNSIDEVERNRSWQVARDRIKAEGVAAARRSSRIVKATREWANKRPADWPKDLWTEQEKALRRRAGPAIIAAGAATVLGEALGDQERRVLMTAWNTALRHTKPSEAE